MREGWQDDDYLILYIGAEVAAASDRYGITKSLPGYEVVGLRGWDELLVRDSFRRTYSIASVPIDVKPLVPFHLAEDPKLQADERYTGKIKWYVKPLALGGDPHIGPNLTWVDHLRHAQLVVWWNDQWRAL